MSDDKPLSQINAAVCAVMKECGYVQKTGYNKHFNYSFVSDADLLAKVQPLFVEHGLTLSPESVDIVRQEPIGNKGRQLTLLTVNYRLEHNGGEVRYIQCPGAGVDNEDKGPYKAMTGALKYALRQTLLIPTGDDAEEDVKREQGQSKEQQYAEELSRYSLRIGDLRHYADVLGSDLDGAMETFRADPLIAMLEIGETRDRFRKCWFRLYNQLHKKPAKKDFTAADDGNSFAQATRIYNMRLAKTLFGMFNVASVNDVPADRAAKFIEFSKSDGSEDKFAEIVAKHGGE